MILVFRTIVSRQWSARRVLAIAFVPSVLVALILASSVRSDEPIRIGVLLSLSGADESLGRDALLGIKLALARKPAALGRRVEILVADAGSDPTQATCAMFRLVEKERVSCVIGDVRSSSTVAASHYAEKKRTPLISLAGPPSCVAKGQRFTLWLGVPDKSQANWAAMVCRTTLGANSAAMICDKSEEYSITVADEFRKAFVGMGGRIAWQSRVRPGGRNLEDGLRQGKVLSPDVLFAPLTAASVAFLARQARIVGLPGTIVATGLAEHRELIEAGGSSVEGIYLVSGAEAPLQSREIGDESAREHGAAEDGHLSAWVERGSKAYRLVLEVIGRARSADAEKICAALAQRHGCPRNKTGESCSTSDICNMGLALRRVENGRFVLIGRAMRTCHGTNAMTNQETPSQPSPSTGRERKDTENCLGSTNPPVKGEGNLPPVDGGTRGGYWVRFHDRMRATEDLVRMQGWEP